MTPDLPSPFGPVSELDLGPNPPPSLITPAEWFATADEPTATSAQPITLPLVGQLPSRPAILAVRAAAQKPFAGETQAAGRPLNGSQRQVMQEVARFPFMTYPLLSRVTGRSESTLRNCVTKHLVPRGLLQADDEQYFGQKVWRATDAGLRTVGSSLRPVPAIDLATYRHDLCTIDATATLISNLAVGETLTTRAEWLSGQPAGADGLPVRIDAVTTPLDPAFPAAQLVPDAVITSGDWPRAGAAVMVFMSHAMPVQWLRVLIRSYLCAAQVDSLIVTSPSRAVRDLVTQAVTAEDLDGFVQVLGYTPSAAVPFRGSDR